MKEIIFNTLLFICLIYVFSVTGGFLLHFIKGVL
jgi:hypothetical protein